MKVPTYTAKLDRPRRGQGQFLTAQLSGSAMAAPARAFARSGQQLAQVGSDLAAFGMKKAQIGADAEAQAASLQLDIELQKMQQEFLANPNMQQAEQKYQDMARLKVETFKSGLSNRLARDAFRGRAAQVTLRNQTSFLKANNARVVEQRKVLLNNDTDDALTYATNPSNSPASRAEVANLGLRNINDALRDLGPELHAKLIKDFYQRLAKGSLISAINKGLDAEETLEDFRTNKSADPVVSAARQNLSPSDVDKIYGEVVTATNRTRALVERKQKRQREQTGINFQKQLQTIVNELKVTADMTDENVAINFNEQTNQLINDTVDAHEGNEESKAELDIQLRRLRNAQTIQIGELQQTARRKSALRKVSDDTRALVTEVNRDPAQLPQAIETLDLSINQSASNFINTEEEENARQGGREDLIEAALNTYIAKGDINSARELFNSPGIAQTLTAGNQENYRQQFIDYDNKRNKFVTDVREKVRAFEEIMGVAPTAKQKMQILGLGVAGDKEAFQRASKLRGEFEKASSKFRQIKTAYAKVKSSAESPSQANDIALIFGFMKMIDPTSVVREGEFATAEAAANIPDRIVAQYNKLVTKKGRFEENQRQEFVEAARKQYAAEVSVQKDVQTRFTNLANLFDLPPQQVLYDLTIDTGMLAPLSQQNEGETSSSATPAPSPDTKPIMLNAEGMRLKEEPK